MKQGRTTVCNFNKITLQYVKNLIYKNYDKSHSNSRVEYCMIQKYEEQSDENPNAKIIPVILNKEEVMSYKGDILTHDEISHIRYLEKRYKSTHLKRNSGSPDGSKNMLEQLFSSGPKLVRKFISSVPRVRCVRKLP